MTDRQTNAPAQTLAGRPARHETTRVEMFVAMIAHRPRKRSPGAVSGRYCSKARRLTQNRTAQVQRKKSRQWEAGGKRVRPGQVSHDVSLPQLPPIVTWSAIANTAAACTPAPLPSPRLAPESGGAVVNLRDYHEHYHLLDLLVLPTKGKYPCRSCSTTTDN